MSRQSRQTRYRTVPGGAPGIISTQPRKRREVGVRFPDGRIIVPPAGVSVDEFARWNGIKLEPKERKPPAGLPHPAELDLADSSLDSSYDEIVSVSGSSSAVPTLSVVSAVPTIGSGKTAAAGFDRSPTDGFTPWRAVTRRYGTAFVGKLALHKINGKTYVKTVELDALASKRGRGSRKRAKNPAGAEARVSKELKHAQAARRRAWEARQRRLS